MTSSSLRHPLLAIALLTVGALALAATGAVVTGQIRHFYLVWNLILAWMPLGLALVLRRFHRAHALRSAGILALVWLLFLPNAPYVLTDFIHLEGTPDAWMWGHWLALVWFSFTALGAGLLSLRIVHSEVEHRFGSLTGWGFVASVSLLTGLGVALGRFHRWNTWDALHQPGEILFDALRHLPAGGSWSLEVAFPWAFGTFFGTAYFLVWSLTQPGPIADPARSLANRSDPLAASIPGPHGT